MKLGKYFLKTFFLNTFICAELLTFEQIVDGTVIGIAVQLYVQKKVRKLEMHRLIVQYYCHQTIHGVHDFQLVDAWKTLTIHIRLAYFALNFQAL